jgi:hypothetical protein
METARDILKQMPWDYDPDRDVWKIAEIIEKNHVLKEYDVWLKNWQQKRLLKLDVLIVLKVEAIVLIQIVNYLDLESLKVDAAGLKLLKNTVNGVEMVFLILLVVHLHALSINTLIWALK